MPQEQDDYTIFQKDENGSTEMAWQLARPHLVENLCSIVKNRLRKQECTAKMKLILSVIHIWFHNNEIKRYLQKVGVINEKMDSFSLTGKRWTYQLQIALKIKFTFFNS